MSTSLGTRNSINNKYQLPENINSALSNANLGVDIIALNADIATNTANIATNTTDIAALKGNFPCVSVTGTTSKTLALSDRNTIQLVDNAATVTYTIPTNASVVFPANGATIINFTQINAGQITFVAAGGVTILSYLSKLSTAGQYAQCCLTKLDTDAWQLTGALI